MKLIVIQKRFDRTVFILTLSLILGVSFLLGCTFGGGFAAPPGELGIYCLTSATRYLPAPNSLSPSGQPALPLTVEGCEDSLQGVDMRWEFVRTDTSNATPIVVEHWHAVFAATTSGEPDCIFRVVIPFDAVVEKGVGTWQVTHKADDWTVVCPEIVIRQCPTDENPSPDYWTSHATIGREGCIQQEVGIDIVDPDFP